MRLWVLLLLPFAAACAGNVADYVGPRAGIVTPQLIRFGFDLEQSRCVGEAMERTMRPVDLRRLARAAAAVQRGAGDRLTPQDLKAAARSAQFGRPGVSDAVQQAMDGCGGTAPAGAVVTNLTELPPPGGAPAAAVASRPTTWLNLGQAGPGQSIAIDASTIEQAETTRTAWFRLTDPGAPPSDDAYLLVIDCANRRINAKARQRRDPAGAVLERIDYPDNPLPVENGTVMEIAWLAMCT